MPAFEAVRLCGGLVARARDVVEHALVGAVLRLRRSSRFVEERECVHAVQRPVEHAVVRQVRRVVVDV
eukprot:1026405-Prymnesium_polylepis.1